MFILPEYSRYKIIALIVVALFVYAGRLHSQPVTHSPDSSGGRLISIGNHKLFVSVTGNKASKYTIVFESGGGGTSQDWSKVIALLPAGTQTIAYDRAGLGKSEQGPVPQTMAQSVFELHALLKATKISGPLILVGQSLGGLMVRLYTEQYEKEVAGLVLVDPTHESSVLGSLKYGGWVRLREKAIGKPVPVPQVNKSVSSGYDSTTDYLAEEFQKIYLSALDHPQALDNRPLIILGAGVRNQPPGTPDEQWKTLRTERDQQLRNLTHLSGNAKFILVPGSSHSIHYDNPEIVARSVQEVINALVDKKNL